MPRRARARAGRAGWTRRSAVARPRTGPSPAPRDCRARPCRAHSRPASHKARLAPRAGGPRTSPMSAHALGLITPSFGTWSISRIVSYSPSTIGTLAPDPPGREASPLRPSRSAHPWRPAAGRRRAARAGLRIGRRPASRSSRPSATPVSSATFWAKAVIPAENTENKVQPRAAPGRRSAAPSAVRAGQARPASALRTARPCRRRTKPAPPRSRRG